MSDKSDRHSMAHGDFKKQDYDAVYGGEGQSEGVTWSEPPPIVGSAYPRPIVHLNEGKELRWI